MKLSEKPEIVEWPSMHYLYVERVGPFQETAPQAWGLLRGSFAEIAKIANVQGRMSLWKARPQMLYRAGVRVETAPARVPEGLSYLHFEGGKYAQFTLLGSYSQLPAACGRVFEIVEQTKVPMRDSFFIEAYPNDPATTPESELITQILIPTF